MSVHPSTSIGANTRIINENLVNIFGCVIGENNMIGPFVEIQQGVSTGEGCRIQSHSFLCEGTTLGNFVFIGHGVMFTNDRWPRAANWDGTPKGKDDWVLEPVVVGDWVSIGSSATLLPGVHIGDFAVVGAGSVVTKDVPEYAIVVGSPARVVGDVRIDDPSWRNQKPQDD